MTEIELFLNEESVAFVGAKDRNKAISNILHYASQMINDTTTTVKIEIKEEK